MLKNSFLNTTLYLFLMLCVSCAKQSDQNDEAKPSPAEMAFQKLVAESRVGIPTPFDFSKEYHYTFFKYHLERANYTPEKFPQLYKSLEEAKTMHIRNGGPNQVRSLEVPSLADIESGRVSTENLADGYAVTPIQQITSLGSEDAVNYNTSGISTVPGAVYINQIILGMYDLSGTPIGPASDSTLFGSGQDLVTATTGTLSTGTAEAKSILTYFYEDSSGTPFHGYVYGATSAAPKHINNTNPVIKVQGNTEIFLCLGRSLGNCDYSPQGGSGSNVLLPISGYIVFGGPIDPINSDSTNVSSLITMARTKSQGGGCIIKSTNNFFGDPNTTISNDTLAWDLSPAHFEPASGCLQANANAIYTFTVMVNVNGLPVFVSITNAPDTKPSDPYKLKIPNLNVVFSCLPDGTRITMADGSKKGIESIEPGDKVIADAGGRILTVHSTMRGKDEQVYAFETENGLSVRMTKGHPAITQQGDARVPVLAKNLKTGDLLVTEKGASPIQTIKEEAYDGYVWNLVIDQTGEMNKKSEDQSTYFANGVLVGDSYMQFKYGQKDRVNPTSVRKILPEKWLKDYASYLER